jgi:hypothetical protein
MRKIAFTITPTRDGVFLTQATPSGNNRTRVADPIRVRSIGTRLTDKVTLVEIKFKTIHGDYQSEMFEFSYRCGQLLMYRYFRNSILIDLLPELFPPGFRERERTQA